MKLSRILKIIKPGDYIVFRELKEVDDMKPIMNMYQGGRISNYFFDVMKKNITDKGYEYIKVDEGSFWRNQPEQPNCKEAKDILKEINKINNVRCWH